MTDGSVKRLKTQAPEGVDPDRMAADMVVSGVGMGAVLASSWSQAFPQASFEQTLQALNDSIQRTRANDLGHAEAMLVSQAVALNAIFGELAQRSSQSLSTGRLEVAERCMRLALKAQTQSRATLETLATIKNPPVVFAKQANVNNGGQQQINNGVAAADAGRSGESKPTAVTHARGEILDFGQSKVLTRMSVNASEPPNTADSLATHAVNGRDSQPLGN